MNIISLSFTGFAYNKFRTFSTLFEIPDSINPTVELFDTDFFRCVDYESILQVAFRCRFHRMCARLFQHVHSIFLPPRILFQFHVITNYGGTRRCSRSVSGRTDEELHPATHQIQTVVQGTSYQSIKNVICIQTAQENNLAACVIEKTFSTFLTAIMCFLHDSKTFLKNNRTLDSDIYSERFR